MFSRSGGQSKNEIGMHSFKTPPSMIYSIFKNVDKFWNGSVKRLRIVWGNGIVGNVDKYVDNLILFSLGLEIMGVDKGFRDEGSEGERNGMKLGGIVDF